MTTQHTQSPPAWLEWPFLDDGHRRLAMELQQAAALLHQPGVEGVEGRPQEALPVGSAAGEAPGRGGIGGGGMNIYRQDPLRPRAGAAEGRVVGEAQIVAEPVDQGGHGVEGDQGNGWRTRGAGVADGGRVGPV